MEDDNGVQVLPTDAVVDSLLEQTVAPVVEDDSKSDEVSIINPILEEMGLLSEFPDIFKFDDGFDIDSNEGIREVLDRSIRLGSDLVMQNIRNNPELYSVFLHFENGGNLDSFKNDNIVVYSDDNLKNNINLQKSLVEDSLRKKDLSDDVIETVVNKIIEKEELEKQALEINNKNKATRDTSVTEKENQLQETKNANSEMADTVSSIVSDSISKNTFSSLKLNNTEKENLYNDLANNIEILNGNAYYKVPISDENIKSIIENHLLLMNPKLKEKLVSNNVATDKVTSLKDKRNTAKLGKAEEPMSDTDRKLEYLFRT
jgi:hypothetical protein